MTVQLRVCYVATLLSNSYTLTKSTIGAAVRCLQCKLGWASIDVLNHFNHFINVSLGTRYPVRLHTQCQQVYLVVLFLETTCEKPV